MKSIITLTMNPAVDKSARVAQVIVERKLYCSSPRFEPGGGGGHDPRFGAVPSGGYRASVWAVEG